MNTFPTPATTLTPSPWGPLLQSWEGHVTGVDDDGVDVVLRDKTDREAQDAFTTLSWDSIDREDRALVKEGAVFYWSVCEHGSLIRFRRGLTWTADALKQAEQTADLLHSRLFS